MPSKSRGPRSITEVSGRQTPYNDKGCFITFDGSMWMAKEKNVNESPAYEHNGKSSWVLVVKKGRPGRDAR
jgi:hypothetical protein